MFLQSGVTGDNRERAKDQTVCRFRHSVELLRRCTNNPGHAGLVIGSELQAAEGCGAE